MEAVEGYFENGRFITKGNLVRVPERRRVIITILDEVAESKREDKELRAAWIKELNTAISLSVEEELPDIQRSKLMREPIDLSD